MNQGQGKALRVDLFTMLKMILKAYLGEAETSNIGRINKWSTRAVARWSMRNEGTKDRTRQRKMYTGSFQAGAAASPDDASAAAARAVVTRLLPSSLGRRV